MGWWKAFIPQHLSNAALLNILDICTHFKISQRKGNANRRANAEAFAEISTEVSTEGFSSGRSFYARGKYIENQPQWK